MLPLAVALALAFGCAGRSTSTDPADDDDDHVSGRGGTGGKGGGGGKGGSSGKAGKGGAGGTGGVAGTGGDVPYTDPGCPDEIPPAPVLECDVFEEVSSCPAGSVCKPQIVHPNGSGCDWQVFNMRCTYPGLGEQGAPCENGMAECAEGFICVVGAAHGPHCLQMCPLDGVRHCPSGYVCGPTDAEGIGVCG